ncbi:MULTISPECIES: 3-oxoacyl-ACP synthase [Clostridium]|uniref:3-oxoacyl-ACP synthase n=1 Tax=Clostridium TaxID=1485 RepID=UPI00098C3F40|nr:MULTISPECIES: 3-oxoacyl-ACP synthase [Clostridium]MBA8932383.1 3-oxoacyl-[acyl-carrier-protein] synthase-3 [Clostridium beijerinckii]NOW07475.1 3-oxoacyl-[acyl-carrier-protein] synthase-3 [Clostridium beijerinckii]NRT37646.1 3-oxoacyl-[acyl-carrier-protein] synthase-3 [Clostridium beijerinckii]NRT48610.1 3-oxoacyl-[acyl-carrier-protein] synthase-3 [Clostridium beijerinckii]NRU36587.1 3-oxoacyl-[acyl-carrier-protein] synthase-3 [Clostridium beijerinckii]
MNCGIMGIGTYIPNAWMTAEEISSKSKIPENIIIEKFGLFKKPIPRENDTPSYMGIKAAEKAITDAGISPKEIDVVIWVGGQHKDYLSWISSIKIANEIGAINACGFDMSSLCCSMVSGIEVAKSLLVTNKKYNTILLVSGSRDVDFVDYTNPETAFLIDVGAGGSAMVIRKNYNKNVILGSSIKCDGTFAESCIVEYGAAKHWPIKNEEVNKINYGIKDVESFKEKLGTKTIDNFEKVVKESLKYSGMTESDIDYLAMLHFKKSAHNNCLDRLHLNADKTTYLSEYGHVGQNDQILSIELGLKSGKIKDGSNVVMVGAGLGFIWAATVIAWGNYLNRYKQERENII